MRKLTDWIDYMEKECHKNQTEKLDLLLKHSLNDQLILDNLRRLRQTIEHADPAQDIEEQLSDRVLMAELHNDIMTQVKKHTSSIQREDQKLSLVSCKR